MDCPVCGTVAAKKSTGNGGELYIAEDLGDCTECWASVKDNALYECTDPKCNTEFAITD